MLEVGTLLKKKDSNELDIPVFVWDVSRLNGKTFYIVNYEKGLSKTHVEAEFSGKQICLPNHAKFKLLTEESIFGLTVSPPEPGYEMISDWIKLSKDRRNLAPDFFINMAYGCMHVIHAAKFTKSKYCESVKGKIHYSPYILVKKLSEIKDEKERGKQSTINFSYLWDLEWIPKRFVLLKIITTLKNIVSVNFPAENALLANSLIEKLLLGMFLSYYKANRDKIKSVTVNYSQKFPGDFKVFQQFSSILNKFEEEINMYEIVHKEELKIELSAALIGAKLPEREDGKGIIMKLLEFDMAFWQKLILLDIDTDLPVRKPYKDGFSISYNYMLLFPFFQWLAPHQFPMYSGKRVNAETFNKVVVERMKNFVGGKIS